MVGGHGLQDLVFAKVSQKYQCDPSGASVEAEGEETRG
jgi:hypothetical protein